MFYQGHLTLLIEKKQKQFCLRLERKFVEQRLHKQKNSATTDLIGSTIMNIKEKGK